LFLVSQVLHLAAESSEMRATTFHAAALELCRHMHHHLHHHYSFSHTAAAIVATSGEKSAENILLEHTDGTSSNSGNSRPPAAQLGITRQFLQATAQRV
jgi:hypothetical protein